MTRNFLIKRRAGGLQSVEAFDNPVEAARELLRAQDESYEGDQVRLMEADSLATLVEIAPRLFIEVGGENGT